MAQTRNIKGKEHQLVVLYITERDAHGRAKKATIMYDEETVDVQEGMEFATAFIPIVNLRKKN